MSETRQIHNVRSVESWRYVEGEHGRLQRRHEVQFARSDTDRIVHPEYGEFEVDPDGSFYVPEEVAEHFLRQPNWHAGPSPFAPEPAANAA